MIGSRELRLDRPQARARQQTGGQAAGRSSDFLLDRSDSRLGWRLQRFPSLEQGRRLVIAAGGCLHASMSRDEGTYSLMRAPWSCLFNFFLLMHSSWLVICTKYLCIVVVLRLINQRVGSSGGLDANLDQSFWASILILGTLNRK